MSMDLQNIIDLAGDIPFDNIDKAEAIIENFCTESIAIVLTNRTTGISRGTHLHDSYEFVICHSQIPSTVINNKVYYRNNNTLFTVNPMQEHGMAADMKGFHLCGIHIDKNLIQSVAENFYGSPNIIFSNDSFTVSHDLSMLLRLLLEELKFKQSGYEFMAENLSLLIAGNLLRQVKHNLPSKPNNIIKNNKENVKAVIDYMNENYSAGISCTLLSNLVKMDKFGFIRSFKAETGKTPYEYLLDLKIEKAKKMLKINDYSVTEISMLCGFSSHSHFTSTFKKKTGMSPTEYKLEP